MCVCRVGLLGVWFVFVRFRNGSDLGSGVCVCLCGCVFGALHISNQFVSLVMFLHFCFSCVFFLFLFFFAFVCFFFVVFFVLRGGRCWRDEWVGCWRCWVGCWLAGWLGVGLGVGRVVREPPFLLFRKRIQFFVLLFFIFLVSSFHSTEE